MGRGKKLFWSLLNVSHVATWFDLRLFGKINVWECVTTMSWRVFDYRKNLPFPMTHQLFGFLGWFGLLIFQDFFCITIAFLSAATGWVTPYARSIEWISRINIFPYGGHPPTLSLRPSRWSSTRGRCVYILHLFTFFLFPFRLACRPLSASGISCMQT